MRRDIEPLPRRVVYVKGRLYVARHGNEPSGNGGGHPYGVQFKKVQSVVIIERPQLRKVLHERAYDVLRSLKLVKGVRYVVTLKPCARVERHLYYLVLRKFLY